MSRQWRPGDVARICYGEFTDTAVRIDPQDWAVAGGTVRDRSVTEARLLVVIDPEDREQIERLLDLLGQRGWGFEAESHDDLATALREFAGTAS